MAKVRNIKQKEKKERSQVIVIFSVVILVGIFIYMGFFRTVDEGAFPMSQVNTATIPKIDTTVLDSGILEIFRTWTSAVSLEVGPTGRTNPFSQP